MISSESPAPQRVRVLVADDSVELRDMLAMILASESLFEVVGLEGDGEAAIRAVETYRPDLVLLDVSMPVMDGLQALTIIRERFPRTAVVMLSGFAEDSAVAEKCLDLGAMAFFTKAERPRQMLAHVRELLELNGYLAGDSGARPARG